MNYLKLKSYRILYTFNHSKMGFQNSVTVKAFTLDNAMEDAKKQVAEAYGSGMINKFSFKPDPVYYGVVL